VSEQITTVNHRYRVVEVGELIVPQGDVIGPSKLKLLATSKWSIRDALHTSDGGFRLLLQRPREEGTIDEDV
jgi:hypothetical protein